MSSNENVINLITRDVDDSAILNTENLKKILLQSEVKDCPVAFYSICGSKRTGKSFLWNVFVHYLKSKIQFLKDIVSKKAITEYFEWKAGVDRHTEGILVYAQPFFLQTRNYGKVALFLMDTQGMFDNVESGENCGMIVALSFLISSIQIYNVHHLIESSHLQYSYKFSKVWKIITNQDEVDHPCAGSSLMFIVRDWRKKRSYKLGLGGGKKYVEDLMEINDEQAEDQRHVRREIKDNFLDVSGCLLPEPGDDIVDEDPESTECNFSDVQGIFYKYSQELFEYLCNNKNIVVKTVNGKVVKASELCENIIQLAEGVTSFSGVSENFRSFVEHDYKMRIRMILLECLKRYMQAVCNVFKDHVENDNFEWRKLIKEKEKSNKEEPSQKSNDSFENSNAEDVTKMSLIDEDDNPINIAQNQKDEASGPSDDGTKSRWKPFFEKLGKKNLTETEDENQDKAIDWKEVLEEHHKFLKNKAMDEYDQAPKPGSDMFKQRWRSILETLIEENYIAFQNCAKAEEVFNELLIEFNNILRSSASGERFIRTFSPLNSAKDRSKEALQKCKYRIFSEIDQSIAKQSFEYFKEKADILLNEHLNRIKRRIDTSVAAVSAAVVGAGAAAAALFVIPGILAGVIASQVSTTFIISAAVGGGATLAASGATIAANLHHDRIQTVLEENWDYSGDDIGFVKADVEVLLSFGIVKFPQKHSAENKPVSLDSYPTTSKGETRSATKSSPTIQNANECTTYEEDFEEEIQTKTPKPTKLEENLNPNQKPLDEILPKDTPQPQMPEENLNFSKQQLERNLPEETLQMHLRDESLNVNRKLFDENLQKKAVQLHLHGENLRSQTSLERNAQSESLESEPSESNLDINKQTSEGNLQQETQQLEFLIEAPSTYDRILNEYLQKEAEHLNVLEETLSNSQTSLEKNVQSETLEPDLPEGNLNTSKEILERNLQEESSLTIQHLNEPSASEKDLEEESHPEATERELHERSHNTIKQPSERILQEIPQKHLYDEHQGLNLSHNEFDECLRNQAMQTKLADFGSSQISLKVYAQSESSPAIQDLSWIIVDKKEDFEEGSQTELQLPEENLNSNKEPSEGNLQEEEAEDETTNPHQKPFDERCQTAIIGIEGGRIEFKDFKHCYVEFPPEAVDKDVTFNIRLLIGTGDKVSDALILTPTLDCLPSMRFNKPVTISLPTSYKPNNSEIKIVPQCFENDKWEDKQPISHGGKDFIIFKTASFSMWRLIVYVLGSGIYPIQSKTLQYIGYQHRSVTCPCLVWCIRENIYQFESTMQEGQAFRGIFTLKKTTQEQMILKLKLECQINSGLRINPAEKNLPVEFEEEYFRENTFFIEFISNGEDVSLFPRFVYVIESDSEIIQDGEFLLPSAVRQKIAEHMNVFHGTISELNIEAT